MASTTLSHFKIYGLFGQHDIDLDFRDNTLVMVGENGSGKSTVVNTVYYFLTAQWTRLHQIPFAKIEATLNGKTLEIKKEHLEVRTDVRDLLRHQIRRHRPSHLSSQTNIYREDLDDEYVEDRLVREMRRRHGKLGTHVARKRLAEVKSVIEHFDALEETVGSVIPEQILFLPTYRRIEAELADVLPGVELESFERKKRRRPRRDSAGFIELVEFGMNDVVAELRHKLGKLERDFREDLNRLTGTYLSEVLREDYGVARVLGNEALKDAEEVFQRIDQTVLSIDDQKALRDFLEDERQHRHESQDSIQIQIKRHFLAKLFDLLKRQRRRERPLVEFINLCNKYLKHKAFAFNQQNFTIELIRSSDPSQSIDLSALSSGEKQIVSLFAHMCLSESEGFIVLIDEPELSISVEWQETFLVDVQSMSRCHGLLAVTHSPFIFANSLREHARNIARVRTKSVTS